MALQLHPCRVTASAALALLALSGCSAVDRLQQIGEVPAMSKITDPTQAPGYTPVSLPAPNPDDTPRGAGSIWQTGARAFFKDHRASRVGDILTVTVTINDSAKLDNRTQDSRNDTETSAGTNVFGLESQLKHVFPSAVDPSALVNTAGTLGTDGRQQVNRSEQITMTVAAMVTQVLPSGNLVIVGKQEVRVNYDVRDLQLTGVVRPSDIDATNSVTYDKIAEARIAYGGHGQGSNLQQPRYGTQLLDVVSPF
jgi:flagellar L-ring protein precursor FlgH